MFRNIERTESYDWNHQVLPLSIDSTEKASRGTLWHRQKRHALVHVNGQFFGRL